MYDYLIVGAGLYGSVFAREMKEAAKLLEFEHAAFLRDRIAELKGEKK